MSIYLEKVKTLIQKDIRTPTLTAEILTIAKSWKQPKCPAGDQWIKKIQCMCVYRCRRVRMHAHRHTHTKLEYYSAIKKNKIMSFATKWMDLENIIFWLRKANVTWYHLYVESKKLHKRTYLQNRNRLIDIENKLMVTKGKGRGNKLRGLD